MAAVATAAVDSVVEMVLGNIRSGQLHVVAQSQAPIRAAKNDRMKKYHTVTRMIADAKSTQEVPENAPPEVYDAIERAKQEKAAAKARMRQERERKENILGSLVNRREVEKKQIEKWEQDRIMRMEELRKFKEDQMTKKHLEWRERREKNKKKNDELTIMAKQVVNGYRRETTIEEQLEQSYKEKLVYPELERAKQVIEDKKAERMQPMGDSLRQHEAAYLQSQARRIQNAAQNNSQMVQARNVEVSTFPVNKQARENAIADDLRARTEKKRNREEAAARVREARTLGTNYEREYMPAISPSAREEVMSRQEAKARKDYEISEKKDLRFSEGFRKQAHDYIHETYLNPTRESPLKGRKIQTPDSEKPRKKIDYIAELRANRPNAPAGPAPGRASPRTPRNRTDAHENQRLARKGESAKKNALAREQELQKRAGDMDPVAAAMSEARVDELYRDAIAAQLQVLKT